MATPILEINTYNDGSVQVSDYLEVEWPDPLLSVDGTITHIGKDFARTRGWKAPHWKRKQTNMVQPMFHVENGEPVLGKDIIRLDRRKYWVDEFYIPWLGFELWSRYCQKGFWREDTNARPTDPVTGEFKEQTIDCGCNLHKLTGNSYKTMLGLFQEIEGVDYFSHPDPTEINYYLTPHKVIKQVLASISDKEPVAYITHVKGDLVVPNVYEHPLIIQDSALERFPALPFETKYLGKSTVISAYCFQASKVFGLFEDGWRIIEESVISGIGSAYYDRRVYVDGWISTPPPTIRGYTFEKEEKEIWQIE